MLPPEVLGWRPAERDMVYGPDTLYDYIDGAAEVYRSFNVRRVIARRYVNPGHPDIIVDVFDMGSPNEAFGVYRHEVRQGESAGIGQESEYLRGSLAFWKDNFYVAVTPFDDTPETQEAVLALGTAVAQAIPGEGPLPDLIRFLPEEERVPASIRYFHNHACLNLYYFLADSNVLDLSGDTEGVLARYIVDEHEPMTLLVIRYPESNAAREALASFQAVYLPEADADGLATIENGRVSGAEAVDTYIIAVLDAPNRETALTMRNSVKRRVMNAGAAERRTP